MSHPNRSFKSDCRGQLRPLIFLSVKSVDLAHIWTILPACVTEWWGAWSRDWQTHSSPPKAWARNYCLFLQATEIRGFCCVGKTGQYRNNPKIAIQEMLNFCYLSHYQEIFPHMIPCSTIPNSIYLFMTIYIAVIICQELFQALYKNYSTSKTLSGRFLYYPHLTDKGTETERSQEHMASKQQSQSSTQAGWPKNPCP